MLEYRGIELFSEHTPPNLERLFGYQSSKRWVAFFWGELVNRQAVGYCFDGKNFSPLNALAWDTFFCHPLMVAMNHTRVKGLTVKRFDFGDSLHTSKDCLLLDRRQRRLHAAQKACALEHLKMEVQATKSADERSESFQQPTFLKTNGELSTASACSLQMVADMTAWLDDRKEFLEKTGQWPKLS